MTTITHCLLSGYKFPEPRSADGLSFSYTSLVAGNVNISLPLAIEYINKGDYNHYLLAGICKNLTIRNEMPIFLSTTFINHGLSTYKYPKSFHEKANHLLKLLYDLGANEYKSRTLFPLHDYPLCFCETPEEFERVVTYLGKEGLLEWPNRTNVNGSYTKVLLTQDGIKEVEKGLPKVPMIGLVTQEITTSDAAIDEKINHAKKLFFDEPQTMEHMRSACVTLAAVLEPLRSDLTSVIARPDVEAFFQLVNNFDIRHNHNKVMTLEHPEQLEWVFYSLLNTINVYYKLKIKLA
ncbi:hypothetical protein [Mucilaginibacter dorajii]|uniref:Uncharacterized protein n=1 Tax=Mucilaginibacter dorajii TaxID=692994 RepID=A0ABP7PPP7_9SPHI|nr:hypothetical protein [Mucilaginibacter dorajii]MCS3736933.1 hypothetical protein [Mucilaginibacter dorajii]